MGQTRVHGRVVTPEGVVDDGVVAVSSGQVVYVGRAADAPAAAGGAVTAAPEGGYVLPGLVDLHVHGGGGAGFDAGNVPVVASAAQHHLRHGTVRVLAGIVTGPPHAMVAAVEAAADATDAGTVAGIHVEGPFLAQPHRGAQDPRHLRPPDAGLTREIVEAGRGHVRVMTLAPELPGAEAVVDLLLGHGVTPAVGHTAADPATVRRVLARTRAALGRPGLVTHLFNGMPVMHHRHPGPVVGALEAAADGDACVELVADGVHLADETVRLVFGLLGAEHVVLVTDAMAAAGMPDGDYELGPRHVRVRDGVARLADGDDAPLAGGTAHLLDVVRRCVHAGVAVTDAVVAATRTPARVLGVGTWPELAAGRQADLVLTDADLAASRVMRAGEWVR